MPIGPVSDSHREISIVEPVSPALERVKVILFRPFDLGKWFTIGFCAWLAGLGESGGSGGGNWNENNFNAGNKNQHFQESFRHAFAEAKVYLADNLFWIIPVAAVVLLLALGFWLLILWLNSRGKFMFLHCVALNRAEVAEPWARFEPAGNSLFGFRIVLGLAQMILLLPLLVTIAALIVRMMLANQPNAAAIIVAVGLALFFLVLAIAFAVVHKFTADFVVPVMYLRQVRCVAAWKEFYGLLSAHAGKFTLYLLFQIVLGMAIGIIVLAAIVITCCLAGCLMIIPYIGTVLLLPVLIFKRAYSLYFIRQFGPAYDVFPTEPPLPPAPAGLQPLAGGAR